MSQNALPAKVVWIDSFAIGIYEVTNAQFANWLNLAHKHDRIVTKDGKILDQEGKLLFLTRKAEPLSRIQVKQSKNGNPIFFPIRGKQDHPVIFVTWYGADAFCKDHKGRLPTEAEWEKAASVPPAADVEKIKKYRYGFGKNTIGPAWANYNLFPESLASFAINTKEVGFYDGNTSVMVEGEVQPIQTENATSPYGAYDMSGNVWEWTADWFSRDYDPQMSEFNPQGPDKGLHKVAKGGCYDSPAQGVRSFERIALLPEHADAYTGFRIAH